MNKKSVKLFGYSEPAEPSAGFFDRIICAIKNEQEFRHTKRLFFAFLMLLIISCAAAPFSSLMFISQIKDSGILHFLSMIVSDFALIISSWKIFGLALLESLPIIGIIIFVLNIALALFTIRLFLHKKQFLFKYLLQKQLTPVNSR